MRPNGGAACQLPGSGQVPCATARAVRAEAWFTGSEREGGTVFKASDLLPSGFGAESMMLWFFFTSSTY